MNLNMVCLAVGEPFPAEYEREYGKYGEYVVFDFISSVPEIVVKYRNLSSDEKKDMGHNSRLEFRYYTSADKGFGILLIKFGRRIVQDYAFDPKLRADIVKGYIKNEGNALNVFVVEATTNNLEIMRTVGLTSQVASKLHKQWGKMLNSNYSHLEFQEWVNSVYLKYPQPNLLWERADYLGKIKFED